MEQAKIDKVKSMPQFHQLVKERSSLAWKLTIAMLVVYYGYILLIAFDPAFFEIIAWGKHATIGFPVGVGIILFAIAITGIYVRKANSDFDELTQQIKDEVEK